MTDVFKVSFPDTLLAIRPLVENINIPHPDGVAGFVTGLSIF